MQNSQGSLSQRPYTKNTSTLQAGVRVSILVLDQSICSFQLYVLLFTLSTRGFKNLLLSKLNLLLLNELRILSEIPVAKERLAVCP